MGKSTEAKRSVLVVGAGVFGAAAALELAHRGWDVSVIDPGPLPHPRASSTDISKIVRMDYGPDEFYTELMEIALPRWEEWNHQWPRALYHRVGFLIMSADEMKPGGFEHDGYHILKRRGHALDRTDSDRLRERHPAWNAERYRDGYFNPDGGWAESSEVVTRLLSLAREAGATLREGIKFGRLIESGSRVTGVESTDGEKFSADTTLVAAGAWTPALLPHLADCMRTVGQPVIQLKLDDPRPFQPPALPPWGAEVSTTGWYGFPALDDGTFKIGNHGPGVLVHPDAPDEIPEGHIDFCREFLSATFPAAADAPLLRTRLCLYCDSWDGDFYIDHDPDRPGLFVATGGSGHGFKFAPVLGEIIADTLERKPNRFAERFAWRPAGAAFSEPARYLVKEG